MNIGFTRDKEKKRLEEREKSWELLKTTSLVKAVHEARELGWKENKVQVRVEKSDDGITYYVEPYEQGCGCRGLLKYAEYFN